MLQSIERVEYDIVEHCNLNCKNCGHMSQFKAVGEKPVEEIEEEIRLLTQKFKVNRFRVMGGEPLLHTKITNVLMIIRKLLGNESVIMLVTNGVKLNSMGDFFFLVLKSQNIRLSISQYPVKIDYDSIRKKLSELEIPFDMDPRPVFYDYIDHTGSQDGAESFRMCRELFCCPFYYKKKFYVCAYVPNVPFINQKYGYHIEQEFVSIEDDTDKIMKYLYRPCVTCKYCFSTRKPHMWKIEGK